MQIPKDGTLILAVVSVIQWGQSEQCGSEFSWIRAQIAELTMVSSALFLTGALKHGMLGGAIQLTFRRMAFDYYPFHRAGREPVGSQPEEGG